MPASIGLTDDGIAFFEKNIRPVLVEKCYNCHSLAEGKSKGGLYVDSKAGLLKGGDSGPSVVPGDPDKSLLIQAIRYTHKDIQMPPKGKKLEALQITHFEEWVKMGAPDPRDGKATTALGFDEAQNFWSFKKVSKPEVPPVANSKWAKTPIDAFLMQKLEASGLQPNPPADKRTLIRRATFDLTGLPSSPLEVENFLNDTSPNAFEKVIDRLLASRHYGEQWGRHWLDVVRYADTSGCNSDYPIPTAYKYRNYVVQSFNQDKPYNQFVQEQVAGDLLPSKSDQEKFDKVIATGYLAISRRFGSRNNEFHLTIEDTLDNMSKAFLGLSFSCARCHDHKFDPITTRDYYALYGIFSSTKYAFPGTEIYKHPKDFVPLATGTNYEGFFKYQTELADLDDRIETLLEERRAIERLLLKDKPEEEDREKKEQMLKDLASVKLEGKRTLLEVKADLEDARQRQRLLELRPPPVEKAYAVSEGKIANSKIQKKGDPRQLGDEVPRGWIKVLGGQSLSSETKSSGRLELAHWLTDPASPLFSRVMVNRVWQHHFGKGLVQTPNDFGTRGKVPTHPELLDYLTSQFVDKGWSVKAMHKMIMLSSAYQMSSSDNSAGMAKDPNNDLLWKFNRRRLSAEELRDAMLAVSSAMDWTVGGEHPFPPENEWRYTQHRPFVMTYDTRQRSLYMMQQRIKKHPFLEIFDGADSNAATGERSLTTTPLQALFLMNDPLAHEAADKLAVRVGMAYPDARDRIDYAFRLAYGRPVTKDELRNSQEYLDQCLSNLRQTDTPLDQQPRAALASLARVLMSSNEFLYLD